MQSLNSLLPTFPLTIILPILHFHSSFLAVSLLSYFAKPFSLYFFPTNYPFPFFTPFCSILIIQILPFHPDPFWQLSYSLLPSSTFIYFLPISLLPCFFPTNSPLTTFILFSNSPFPNPTSYQSRTFILPPMVNPSSSTTIFLFYSHLFPICNPYILIIPIRPFRGPPFFSDNTACSLVLLIFLLDLHFNFLPITQLPCFLPTHSPPPFSF